MQDKKVEEKTIDTKEKLSRRKFLKKSVYTTPVLVSLGQLLKPTIAHADSTGGPDGPPGDWTPW